MSVMTHDAKWRLAVGAAPVIGVYFLVWAMAQGDAQVARSPGARLLLAVVGVHLLGLVADAVAERIATAVDVDAHDHEVSFGV